MQNDTHRITIQEIINKVGTIEREIDGIHHALIGNGSVTNLLEEDDAGWPPIKKLMAKRFRDCVKFRKDLLNATVEVSDYISWSPTTPIEGII